VFRQASKCGAANTLAASLVGIFQLEEKTSVRGHAGLLEISVGVTPLTKELDNAIAYYQLMSLRYCDAT
jgi:hypothetical protein